MTSLEIRTRDFAADMRKLIDEGRSSGQSYNAAELAQRIVDQLLHEDRELLYGWLEAHATTTIRAAIVATDAATRSYARASAPASVFAAAAAQAGRGDRSALRQGFLQAVYVVDDTNSRKMFKDMTAADVLFVAAHYDDRAKAAKLEAEFMKAVARKVGASGRVADTFNNVQLAELHQRLTGKHS